MPIPEEITPSELLISKADIYEALKQWIIAVSYTHLLNPITGWAPLVTPITGMVIISRTELITVITPTYRSPPKFCSVALQMICTDPLVTDITKPDIPSPVIFFNNSAFNRIPSRFSFRIAFGPRRNLSTQTADSIWEIKVAAAAPCTPIRKTKINSGSSTISVSYTHLDVYKRQLIGCHFGRIGPILGI